MWHKNGGRRQLGTSLPAMTYLHLASNLARNLTDLGYFAFVGSHTHPVADMAHYKTGGLPAVLIRLTDVSYMPPEVASDGHAQMYRGLARVELTLLASPSATSADELETLAQAIKITTLQLDGSARLVDESSLPAEQLQYRLLFSIKLEEELTV